MNFDLECFFSLPTFTHIQGAHAGDGAKDKSEPEGGVVPRAEEDAYVTRVNEGQGQGGTPEAERADPEAGVKLNGTKYRR